MGDDAESAALVMRILRAKTHYEVLGVQPNVQTADAKKAYYKLAVKCHPDRCRHSKADEAMKKVTVAWDIISDTNKRRHYDQVGDDTATPARAYYRRPPQYAHGPPDLFQELFGAAAFGHPFGGAHGPNVRVFQMNMGGGGGGGAVNFMQPGVFLVLLIVLMTIMSHVSSFLTPSPVFKHRVDANGGYVYKMETAHGRFTYYVQKDFDRRHQLATDVQVLQELRDAYAFDCNNERAHKNRLRLEAQAAWSHREQKMKRYEDYKTPSCDRLGTVDAAIRATRQQAYASTAAAG